MIPALVMAGALAADDPGTPPATAAVTSEPVADWTVTVDPLTFALGYAHVQIERRIGRYSSVYLGPHARLFDGILTPEPEPYLGFGGEVGVRVFPWGRAPTGPWMMGRQVLARLHTTDGSASPKVGGYSSVLVGYTGIVAQHLVLSGGAGFNQLYYDIGAYGTSGPFLALHTNIGIAF